MTSFIKRVVMVTIGGVALLAIGCGTPQPTAPVSALAAGTNQSFSHTMTTSAEPTDIWRLWTDVANWGAWDKGLKSASLDGPFIVGAKGKIMPLSGGSADFEITAINPGVSYTFETKLPAAKLIVTRTLTATAPTTFRHDVRFEGAMAGVLSGQMGPQFRAALPPTMAELSALAGASK